MDTVVNNAKLVAQCNAYPKRALDSLQLNISYHVISMRNVTTRFGKSVVCELEDTGVCPQSDDNCFHVFLPKRWADKFSDDNLEKIERCGLSLVAKGHTKMPNGMVSVNVDFVHVSIYTFILLLY
jgi:hypothetical protein